MAFLAVSHKLLPADQFGGVPGRSAEDAALATVHDIEAARNVQQVTVGVFCQCSEENKSKLNNRV